MNVKILGPGCPNCQKLEANTKQALEELKLEAKVEKISEIQDIMSYGIMSTPALVVDDAVLVAGMVPDVKQIKEALENHKASKDKPAGTCSCGGNC
jgi:small redox-active disulfide protein 2